MSTHASAVPAAKLRSMMRGEVIVPGDPTYDDARKVWNGDIDRRPALIARCASVDDVRAALAFGLAQGLRIVVKSGGHSLPGHCIADGALMIDLRPMNKVEVDVANRRATVQGGAIWSEVDAPTQAAGLGVTGGHVSHTGVAGLTLGGGIGHLMRKHGLVVDNLESAEIVTADGRVLRASATENEDLFWAIRGGGGNFGIATEFVIKLVPVGPIVLGGLAFWAPDKGPELLQRYREFCKTCPDELTTILVHLYAPPFEFVPKAVQMTPGYALIAVGTDIPLAEQALKELRGFGPPLFDIIGPMPYLAVQGMLDPAQPPGTKTYAKSHYLPALTDQAMAAFHAGAMAMPAGPSAAFLLQMGGAVARVSEDATAFGGRNAAFQTLFLGVWEDDAGRPVSMKWVRDLWDSLVPSARGAYVNLADDLDEAALKVTYGEAKFARLQKLKAKYDQGNVFNLNQNIRPQA